jgi:hypothetical protein
MTHSRRFLTRENVLRGNFRFHAAGDFSPANPLIPTFCAKGAQEWATHLFGEMQAKDGA